jgi:hypothetical protein
MLRVGKHRSVHYTQPHTHTHSHSYTHKLTLSHSHTHTHNVCVCVYVCVCVVVQRIFQETVHLPSHTELPAALKI